jgi:capsular exopolysaccharide synthesis family protein
MNDQSISLGGPEGHNRLVPVVQAATAPVVYRDYQEEPQSDLIDVRDIWAALWRNRLIIAVIMALAIAAGLASIKLTKPVYRATASVEIGLEPIRVLGTEDSEKLNSSSDIDRFLQTQIDIIRSRALAARVADSLNLAANDNFLNAMETSSDPAYRRSTVIGELQSYISAELPKSSRVIPISYDSPDPATAAKIANSYAENFIAANLQRRFDTSTYSKNFLQSQLALTKGRLEESERSLLAYARAAGIVDPTAGAGVTDGATAGPPSLTTSNLVQLNQAYAAARSARLQAEGRWREAQSTPLMSLPEVLTNPAIGSLTQKRAELESAYQQQLQTRKPDHPAMQQQAAALKELDAQIAALAASVRNSIRNQYETSARQEAALSGTVGQLKGATLDEQTRGIRYNILKREVDTNRQLYDGLLQRFKEVSAQAGVTANNISIVDLAETPGAPVSPNPIINMALAIIGGLALALMVVLGKEMFDDSVRNPEDVERKFGLPLLGAVPKLKGNDTPMQALTDERSAITEAYSAVRASVDLSSDGGPPEALLVTSSEKGEGKSTTALAIAKTSAAAGRKVLLIDADMRSPSMHSLLGNTQGPGLADVLSDQVPIHEAIHLTEVANLHLLPAGQPTTSPAQLLSGVRFATLLHEARTKFDEIVIDSPPVLGLADTPQLAAAADRTIMVIGSDRAHRRAVKEALRRLSAARADMLGAILVKFVPEGPWGRGYYSYYSYDDWAASNAPQLAGSVTDGGEAEGRFGWIARLWQRIRGKRAAAAEQPS